MKLIPPEDVAGFYAGVGLLLLVLGMWVPYMARSMYWNWREDRENKLGASQKK